MSRLPLLLLLVIAASATGCGKSAVQAPMVPERTADHETRTPRRQDHVMPPLIAPPPAYGNKVVMAKAEGGSSVN